MVKGHTVKNFVHLNQPSFEKRSLLLKEARWWRQRAVIGWLRCWPRNIMWDVNNGLTVCVFVSFFQTWWTIEQLSERDLTQIDCWASVALASISGKQPIKSWPEDQTSALPSVRALDMKLTCFWDWFFFFYCRISWKEPLPELLMGIFHCQSFNSVMNTE